MMRFAADEPKILHLFRSRTSIDEATAIWGYRSKWNCRYLGVLGDETSKYVFRPSPVLDGTADRRTEGTSDDYSVAQRWLVTVVTEAAKHTVGETVSDRTIIVARNKVIGTRQCLTRGNDSNETFQVPAVRNSCTVADTAPTECRGEYRDSAVRCSAVHRIYLFFA